MNLAHLETFLVVAEEQSFTRAADALDVSKGMVSRHVRHLEEAFNVKLFHRTTRMIKLTDVGEELYTKAKQIKLIATEAEMRVKDMTHEVAGDLRITAPIEFGRILCRDVVPAFVNQFPGINLIIDTGPLKKNIESGDFDIAFRAYDTLPGDVVAKNFGFIRNVLVCNQSYALEFRPRSIEDLHHCKFILNSQIEGWNTLELIDATQDYTLEVKGKLQSNSYSSILELARQGLGVASLPYYQVETDIKNGDLVHLIPEWSVRTHKMSAIYAQRKVTPKKIVTFIDMVTRWLGASDFYLM